MKKALDILGATYSIFCSLWFMSVGWFGIPQPPQHTLNYAIAVSLWATTYRFMQNAGYWRDDERNQS